MSELGVAIRSRRVLCVDGIRPACVQLRGSQIVSVTAWDAPPTDVHLHDFGNSIVMPGLVDTHVHVNEPGRTEWEGFDMATRAAAAGGVTTVLDMPLNSIPATTTRAALETKRAAAANQCAVNVGFLGGLVRGNLAELEPLWTAGVFAFKCFLVPSGVDEFSAVGEKDLRAALPVVASLGATLMVHAELPALLLAPAGTNGRRYASYLASRPAAAESEAIALVARLAGEYRARVHIVHVSCAESIAEIRRARERGVAITAETCPHYLTFAAEDISDGATELKCAPPIRTAEHREALWQALARGDLDLVVSDHSPCPPSLKRRDTGDFFQAWGGISSLQLGLAAMWEGARARGFGPERLASWMSGAPARLAYLGGRKGSIAAGYDADIVAWDPERTIAVREDALFHRHTLTPYLGRTLHGRVHATFVGGEIAYIDGQTTLVGRLLRRDVTDSEVPRATESAELR